MRTVTAYLKSISPYSQSKHYEVPTLSKERKDDYEFRTWRERMHVNEEGFVYIPPMAFKNCISQIAKYLGMPVPGKGKNLFTKHFESGVLVIEGLQLPFQKDSVAYERLFVPANGRRGGGSRVWKYFPLMPQWHGHVQFHIVDDTITQEVFETHLRQAGQFVGLGRFRPASNGYYGRFEVEKLAWAGAED